jgi:hypothetical protein
MKYTRSTPGGPPSATGHGADRRVLSYHIPRRQKPLIDPYSAKCFVLSLGATLFFLPPFAIIVVVLVRYWSHIRMHREWLFGGAVLLFVVFGFGISLWRACYHLYHLREDVPEHGPRADAT